MVCAGVGGGGLYWGVCCPLSCGVWVGGPWWVGACRAPWGVALPAVSGFPRACGLFPRVYGVPVGLGYGTLLRFRLHRCYGSRVGPDLLGPGAWEGIR